MDLEDILKLKDGVDCERDVEQAARLLMEKANGGSGEAARELGILYAYGSGVRQDDRTSTEYFRKGAELNGLELDEMMGSVLEAMKAIAPVGDIYVKDEADGE